MPTLTTNPTSAVSAVRILLVDDSELVRTGLRALMASFQSIHVVDEADTVSSAFESIKKHRPDVVLLDIRLPDGSGIDACSEIRRKFPQTHILILSSYIDDALVSDALRAGARGYLLKDINGSALLQGIIDVANGKHVLSPAATNCVISMMRTGQQKAELSARYDTLSPQEQRVLAQVAEGKTNKEVATVLNLSEKTVKNYLRNIFEKISISRRSQAAAFFTEVKSTLR